MPHYGAGPAPSAHHPDRAISWCWHEDLEIPVGRSWWCEVVRALGASTVEPEQWRPGPVDGQQCRTCRYSLDPEDSVSYCWRPGMQVGVGIDHWCRGWDAPRAAL